ncbi:hypothetical protein ID866_12116 [Astraeus odoratus]|nr:hypothetical protein ID866_12116 [Astraeus odoratus]
MEIEHSATISILASLTVLKKTYNTLLRRSTCTTGSAKRRFNRPTDIRLPPKTPQTNCHLLPLILVITSLPLILPHLLRPTTTTTTRS